LLVALGEAKQVKEAQRKRQELTYHMALGITSFGKTIHDNLAFPCLAFFFGINMKIRAK